MAASLTLPNSFIDDLVRGRFDFSADTFKMMLCNGYTLNEDTHDRRDDVTNEVAATGGYTAGGQVVTVTIGAINTTDNTLTITFGPTTWSSATITATEAVIYKSRGGLASADELVGVHEFDATITSTGGSFVVNASTATLNLPGGA